MGEPLTSAAEPLPVSSSESGGQLKQIPWETPNSPHWVP